MRYFVIMGNTRVGSTWFQSAMHALPDVFCTREIRWRMPYMDAAPPVHTYIDAATTSIKERLALGPRMSGRDAADVVGAKLKFDPFGYVPPPAFGDLAKIIEDDVHVVFLRRSYFEIFQTWKAFGIRHLANPNAKGRKTRPNAVEAARLNRFRTMHSVPVAPKQVFITSDGRVVARYLHNKYRGSDKIYYSIAEAIDDLLVLFYNDLMGLSVLDGRADADLIEYRDIPSRFFGVVQKLGLPVSREDCADVLANASTLRIEPEGVEFVHPSGALKEVSDYLDGLFYKVRAGETAREEIVRVDAESGTVTFDLPELPAMFARHAETEGLLRPAQTGAGRALRRMMSSGRMPVRLRKLLAVNAADGDGSWRARRNVYMPLAVAPPPAALPLQAIAARGPAV